MMDITNKQWSAMSDTALMKNIGSFIRHHCLEQNKTQSLLAEEAGINRSTLSQFENGLSSNLITFIQLMRELKLLPVLQVFEVKQQVSPIQLAKLEQSKRIRASRKSKNGFNPESDW
jgi:transcriptional regulator with XRE-family HTH domain